MIDDALGERGLRQASSSEGRPPKRLKNLGLSQGSEIAAIPQAAKKTGVEVNGAER